MRQDEDAQLIGPGTRSFAFLVATLVCLGLVPLFAWLADQRILPYPEEAGWVRARKHLAPLPGKGVLENFAEFHVALERRSCYGTCPHYRVTVWGSGRVEFEGLQFVCAPGRQHAQVDARRAADLIFDLHVGGFFGDLQWTPEWTITDQPTVITEMSVLKLSRKIEHYHGDLAAPRVLHDMEKAIDEVAGTRIWLPRREGRQRFCLDARGNRVRVPQ